MQEIVLTLLKTLAYMWSSREINPMQLKVTFDVLLDGFWLELNIQQCTVMNWQTNQNFVKYFKQNLILFYLFIFQMFVLQEIKWILEDFLIPRCLCMRHLLEEHLCSVSLHQLALLQPLSMDLSIAEFYHLNLIAVTIVVWQDLSIHSTIG